MNKFVVSGSDDKTVRIWETATGKCLQIIERSFRFRVMEYAISSDDKFIVSGSDDKTVRIWEAETGKCLKILEGHSR